MATVKTILDRAARRVSVRTPTDWYLANTDTALDLKDCLAETAREILDRVDLPSPITLDHEIYGSGGEEYALPNTFLRLTRDQLAVYENSATRRYCIHVPSNGGWTHLKQQGGAGVERYFRTYGDEGAGFKIAFFQPLGANDQVTVSYVTRNWLRSSGGILGEEIGAATDVVLIPEEIAFLGTVWRFRRIKGMSFGDINAEYEIRVSRAINDGRGLRTINMGGRDAPVKPMEIPTPDFIPIG